MTSIKGQDFKKNYEQDKNRSYNKMAVNSSVTADAFESVLEDIKPVSTAKTLTIKSKEGELVLSEIGESVDISLNPDSKTICLSSPHLISIIIDGIYGGRKEVVYGQPNPGNKIN